MSNVPALLVSECCVTQIYLTRAVDDAIAPMPADKGAMGAMPLEAFQYCEAMRTASALGWYIFPLRDVSLLFDGVDTYFANDGHWVPLGAEVDTSGWLEAWRSKAPEPLASNPVPWIRKLSGKGIVQVWSGYFVRTTPEFHLLVRPLVNHQLSGAYYCYEGVVQTDTFAPMPLFVNIQLVATDREIQISRDKPLFQIASVPGAMTKGQQLEVSGVFDSDEEGNGFDWHGLRNTLRLEGDEAKIGRYGVSVRKKGK